MNTNHVSLRKVGRLGLLSTLAIFIVGTGAGCQGAGQGALTGAGLGALAGLGLGSLTGDAGKGAAAGAIIGGVGGAIIGDQNERADRRSYDRGGWR